jgi:transglutaminase-like putative cysteine protease
MKYKIIHTTTYHYLEPVPLGYHKIWLHPRNTSTQICEETKLTINPKPSELTSRIDFFGKHTTYFTIPFLHQELQISSQSIVKLSNTNPFHLQIDSELNYKDALNLINLQASRDIQLAQFLLESHYIKFTTEIKKYALESVSEKRPIKEIVLEINERIFKDFEFVPGHTDISTPIEQVMKDKKGVCQDFSHLAIACFRSIGLPARYMSGYIETIPPPNQPKLKGADASHAWVAIYFPQMGWFEIDPTNNLVPNDKHVLLAFGRDYFDVPPIKGIIMSGSAHQMFVSVDMEKIDN